MSFIEDFGLQTANGLVNSLASMVGTNYAAKKQKELMDYQWNNYQSPAAQVRNMAAAGVNPAVAFGNQAPIISSSPNVPSVEAPQFGIGTTSLADLSGYIKSLADAKKAGADTNLAEREAEVKKIESERQEFELNMRKLFGPKQEWINLSTAAANLRLATLSGDNAQIQKEMGVYTKAKEAALAKTAEHQRDIAKKELDNLDLKLDLQNDILRESAKTEKSKQSANYAGARASDAAAEQSKSQAAVNRQIERIQHVFADVEESGKTEKIATLLNHYKTAKMIDDKDYQEAHRMYERLKTINKDNDSSKWNRYADAIMFYLEEHIHGLSPFTGLVR